MINIYNQIIGNINTMRDECTPISDIGHQNGFLSVPTQAENEFYRAELSNGNEKIIISIYGSDHSGELSYRKDTYHNKIEYLNGNGEYTCKEYMYIAD